MPKGYGYGPHGPGYAKTGGVTSSRHSAATAPLGPQHSYMSPTEAMAGNKANRNPKQKNAPPGRGRPPFETMLENPYSSHKSGHKGY